jgi:hypothetical protein
MLGVRRLSEKTTGDISGDGSPPWPLRTTEAYIRGHDLVASYEPAADWPFSPQLYWQADTMRHVAEVRASLSLLVSVQTHLLDTRPRIAVASQLPPGELLLISPHCDGGSRAEIVSDDRRVHPTTQMCCVLVRPRESQITYAEIVAPSDFQVLHVRPQDSGTSIEWELFSEFLEKGVIRRARVHSVLMPRDNDIDLAAACCEATKRLELPLTT